MFHQAQLQGLLGEPEQSQGGPGEDGSHCRSWMTAAPHKSGNSAYQVFLSLRRTGACCVRIFSDLDKSTDRERDNTGTGGIYLIIAGDWS